MNSFRIAREALIAVFVCSIRELKQTDAAAERRRSHSNLCSIKSDFMSGDD